MTEEQILKMIANPDLPPYQGTWADLVREYVIALAGISKKINREDMAALVAFGAVVYQRGLADFRSGIDEEALFKALQEKKTH
jgi:hypothetical protein